MSEPAPQAAEADALIGTTLAERYRIDALLGIGGMGAVYRARHLLLKRDVAVKVLHAQLSANEDISKRFDREAQSAARLDHPNVIPVTEFGSTDDGMKYMVMQLLEGKELSDLLDRALDPLRAIDLEIQILRGLEHAHNNGVIHRDLKPENVFVTTDHEDQEILKLVDFGIAKIVDDDDDDDGAQPLTRMGLVFGTPHYMSPEQATGSPIDHRTDIYSAGVLLYQMLAGRLPFDHDDPVSLIRMQVTVDPPPLDESVPIPLRRVVGMMMAKTRDQRYPDARSARKALQAVQARLADDAGIPVKMSPHDTGLVDPRDIYPEGHEALTSNPAFRSGSASALGSGAYDPSEYSEPMSELGGSEASASSSASGPGVAPTIPPASGSDPAKPKMTQMSLADALTQAHPTLQQRSPFAEWMAAVPRKWWYLGGGILGLLILIALWPGGGDDDDGGTDDKGSVPVAKNDSGDEPVVEQPGIDESTLIAIDRALSSKKQDEALDLIRPARDKFPDDPRLLWREGKALAMKRAKSSRVTALERYSEAIDRDPSLVDDPEFYGELYGLLGNQTLREQAINLSLQKLGPAGHKFLLELVNVDDPRKVLGWIDRHRVLDELRSHPDALKLVDWKLNLARDLHQADKAPKPCTEFAQALDTMASSKDAYYVEHVFSIVVPSRGENEDAGACDGLKEQLVVVRDLLSVAHPEEAAKYNSPKKKKKKKKKR